LLLITVRTTCGHSTVQCSTDKRRQSIRFAECVHMTPQNPLNCMTPQNPLNCMTPQNPLNCITACAYMCNVSRGVHANLTSYKLP
jgi:hypothetical protein